MQELLKNKYYNYNSIKNLAQSIKDVYSSFKVDEFVNDIIDETFNSLELKERMRKITINLGKYLPTDYAQALRIIDYVVDNLKTDFNDNSLIYFPDFIEVYGQGENDWNLSMAALEKYTHSSTAEFAVRPFIIKHEERMMAQMYKWSKSDNMHVRRLSSEGCRPALPWGQSLVKFKKDPSPIINILENLKDDPSLYVRKSVANNLNDISKNHPDLVLKIAKNWYGKSKNTDWIVKHGCRTLLKKGNKDILDVFGFKDTKGINIKNFRVINKVIYIGEHLTFSFDISAEEAMKVRLEYSIDYVKNNKKIIQKVFQISEINLKENEKKSYIKKHSFAFLSSRKHYPGMHSITLIVNGIKQGTVNFEVLDKNNY